MKASRTAESNGRLYCLKDESWNKLEDLFPHRHGERGFEAEISNRTVFEAVLYRARTGCPWRDLPQEYGYWHAIYRSEGSSFNGAQLSCKTHGASRLYT